MLSKGSKYWIFWRLDWAWHRRWRSHMVGSPLWLFTVSWVGLSIRALTCGFSMWLGLFAAWWLDSESEHPQRECSKGPKQKLQGFLRSGLGSPMTSLQQHVTCQLYGVSPESVWERTTQGWVSGSVAHWGHCWTPALPVFSDFQCFISFLAGKCPHNLHEASKVPSISCQGQAWSLWSHYLHQTQTSVGLLGAIPSAEANWAQLLECDSLKL